MTEQIAIERDFLEHLLNCLANQKFIEDVNADGLAMGKEAVNKIQNTNQQAIDLAYEKGRKLVDEAAALA